MSRWLFLEGSPSFGKILGIIVSVKLTATITAETWVVSFLFPMPRNIQIEENCSRPVVINFNKIREKIR